MSSVVIVPHTTKMVLGPSMTWSPLPSYKSPPPLVRCLPVKRLQNHSKDLLLVLPHTVLPRHQIDTYYRSVEVSGYTPFPRCHRNRRTRSCSPCIYPTCSFVETLDLHFTSSDIEMLKTSTASFIANISGTKWRDKWKHLLSILQFMNRRWSASTIHTYVYEKVPVQKLTSDCLCFKILRTRFFIDEACFLSKCTVGLLTGLLFVSTDTFPFIGKCTTLFIKMVLSGCVVGTTLCSIWFSCCSNGSHVAPEFPKYITHPAQIICWGFCVSEGSVCVLIFCVRRRGSLLQIKTMTICC